MNTYNVGGVYGQGGGYASYGKLGGYGTHGNIGYSSYGTPGKLHGNNAGYSKLGSYGTKKDYGTYGQERYEFHGSHVGYGSYRNKEGYGVNRYGNSAYKPKYR